MNRHQRRALERAMRRQNRGARGELLGARFYPNGLGDGRLGCADCNPTIEFFDDHGTPSANVIHSSGCPVATAKLRAHHENREDDQT
ncbi:hypothetical protein H7J77_17180 [Mycolicibacillus parakoreensis]|uniref:Uncharacterized protein n=1 Tax=Mycolicibacillus parakoreensis TaxID=1069221 RepID=A0ABY3TV46_9MYCO|nr:hypothetical protein [Mycolicibacillus parakoreensis]MCV7317270.1 hypothetical protein [Mycolicibacillus parakoreensis]ULN51518.1 hypothetical protein MIU77_11430 [Mycolicibacillus parakoreensis]